MKRHLWILAVAAVVCSPRADAAIRNRYSFNDGTANDSVSAANGTLVGTNGSIAGGELILDNTGEGSNNPPAAGAFVDLPNNLISSAATASGGAVTVEMWVTMLQNRDWAAAFSAGISSGGEGSSAGGGGLPYLQIIPRTGDGGQGNDFRVTSSFPENPASWVDDLGAANGSDLAVGVEEHVVAVFDQSGGAPGTITVYRNGALMGTSAIAASLDLQTFAGPPAGNSGDLNIWLGRSQFGDSLVDAKYDEVRIYSQALSANDAALNLAAGPDRIGIPEPSTLVLVGLALAGGLATRRFRA